MPNPLELKHAEHDEVIAIFIGNSKKSIQWTLIVSFYSALHYLRYKMFPLTEQIGGITTTYNSLNDYYSKLGQGRGSMHDTLVDLAWKYYPEIAAKYQVLYNSSTTARYNHYEHDPRAASEALKHLKAIKNFCK